MVFDITKNIDKRLSINLLKKITSLMIICYYIFICIFFICSSFSGDDISYFVKQSFSYDWLIKERYLGWSSRIVIESILPFLIKHEILFKTINIIVLFSAPFALLRISFSKNNSILLCCLMVSFIPFYEMATAGFAATVTNYFYPIIGVLWILSFVYSKNKNSFIALLLVTLLSFYACNHEQSFVIVIAFVIPKLFEKNNINKSTTYIVFTISLFSLLLTVLCPGNENRIIFETQNWMPEFANFSIFEKLYMGMTTALYRLTYLNNLPFIFCFCSIVLLYSSKLWMALVAIAFNSLYRMPVRSIFKSTKLDEDATWLSNFPVFCFILLMLLVAILSLICIFSNTDIKTKMVLFLLIALAYALRAVVGFSPTVFASGVRPEIFSQIIFLFTGFFALTKSKLSLKEMYIFIGLFSLYNFVKFIYPIPFNLS